MAKRFTDTGKWGKREFQRWPSKMKLAWLYLCDSCDHAGVWDINFEQMSFQINENITLQDFEKYFADRVQILENHLFIKSFIDFQYGELNENNKVHLSVIKRLEKLRFKGLARGGAGAIEGAYDGPKDKEKEKDKEGAIETESDRLAFIEQVKADAKKLRNVTK